MGNEHAEGRRSVATRKPKDQAPGTSYQPSITRNVVRLQRVAGNRAVVQALSRADAPARAPHRPPVVQRAIGFEFEFGTWTTKHGKDGSRLDKGETIIGGDGYKIEGEDGPGADSAIEVVTKPFATKGEAVTKIAHAQGTLRTIKTAGGSGSPAKTVKASAFGGAPDVRITPAPGSGKMQASPGIALDKMAALYRQGQGKGFANAVEGYLGDAKVKKRYFGGAAASEELKGFLMLVLSYLEQGARKQALFYPKSAFAIMARTSFNKMFSLVPEHAFFSHPKNLDRWVDLVLELAQRIFPSFRERETGKIEQKGPFGLGGVKYVNGMAVKEKKKRSLKEVKREAALGMPLMGMEELPGDPQGTGYRSTVTREDWLRTMPDRDLLSKADDKRFEGMGSYGDAVDIEVSDQDVIERTESAVEDAVRAKGVPDQQGGDGPDGGRTPRQAPLFELRGLKDLFGVDQDVTIDADWSDQVKAVFDIVDQANQGTFKPGGKPTIAPDVDNPAAWEKA